VQFLNNEVGELNKKIETQDSLIRKTQEAETEYATWKQADELRLADLAKATWTADFAAATTALAATTTIFNTAKGAYDALKAAAVSNAYTAGTSEYTTE
jgi:hypothetical protein